MRWYSPPRPSALSSTLTLAAAPTHGHNHRVIRLFDLAPCAPMEFSVNDHTAPEGHVRRGGRLSRRESPPLPGPSPRLPSWPVLRLVAGVFAYLSGRMDRPAVPRAPRCTPILPSSKLPWPHRYRPASAPRRPCAPCGEQLALAQRESTGEIDLARSCRSPIVRRRLTDVAPDCSRGLLRRRRRREDRGGLRRAPTDRGRRDARSRRRSAQRPTQPAEPSMVAESVMPRCASRYRVSHARWSFALSLEDTSENGCDRTVERIRRSVNEKAQNLTLRAGHRLLSLARVRRGGIGVARQRRVYLQRATGNKIASKSRPATERESLPGPRPSRGSRAGPPTSRETPCGRHQSRRSPRARRLWPKRFDRRDDGGRLFIARLGLDVHCHVRACCRIDVSEGNVAVLALG